MEERKLEVEKKEPEVTKRQRIVNLVFTIIQIVMVVICVVASIFIITNPGGYAEEPEDCNTSIMLVVSESMSGTFEKNDIIFGKKVPEGILPLGTVVTFPVKYYDGYILDTHRIVAYYYSYTDENNKVIETKVYYQKGVFEDYEDFASQYAGCTFIGYVTRGDKYTFEYGATLDDTRIFSKDANGEEFLNTSLDDFGVLKQDDIVAVWGGKKLNKVGSVVEFLQKPVAFGLIILLPLVLLFAYNIFLIVKMIIADKTEKAKAAALEELKNNQIDEEEIKRKAIEEYLASLKKEENKEE